MKKSILYGIIIFLITINLIAVAANAAGYGSTFEWHYLLRVGFNLVALGLLFFVLIKDK